MAGTTGGAISLYKQGESDGVNVVTFRKPNKIRIRYNDLTANLVGCNKIYLEENSGLIGYESSNLCDES